MSRLRRHAGHDRARELAAVRLDEPLEAGDEAWLDAHLASCPACAAVAVSYEADSALFAGLREHQPLPPRDLWARTAAAIDAEATGSRTQAAAGRRRVAVPLAPLAGLAVVVVVVGTVLISGTRVGPTPAGPGPAATAIALEPGDIAVVTRDADGRLQVLTAGVDEVCPLVADECDVAEPSFETSALAGLRTSGNVDAILSPGRDRLVVVQRDASGADGVYVVPVNGTAAGPGTPTAAPTVEPAPPTTEPPTEPSTASREPATASPAPTVASASPAPSSVASASPQVSATPPASGPPASVPPAGSPSPSDDASHEPTDVPSETPSASAPESDAPEPTPSVAVTPAPDGTIEIANDVVVVGGIAAYDDHGSRFAFTARPADGSTGPDVYVWDTQDTRARAVTTDHRSLFAAWDGGDLLVSRVVDGTPRTIAVNPRTGAELGERGEAAWLPTVSPDGARAAWWDGSVRLAADGVTWVPDRGRLVVGAWPGDPDDAQVLARRSFETWEVRWTPDGSAVATWTSGAAHDDAGRLSLYAIDASPGARLARPLLRDEPAFAGFSLDADRLAYAAPTPEGERTVWVVAWDGDTVGKVELPGEAGATVVR